METLHGNCCCGSVRYELSDVKNSLNCHCSLCRKLTGSAFGSYVIVLDQDFKLLAGADYLSQYDKEGTTAAKYFCKRCGSPIYNRNQKYPGVYIVYLGSLVEGLQPTPKLNIYCENKLDWLENLFTMENLPTGIRR